MPLQSGDKLGPYEILSLLGKGGMGEVYRSRDTKLKRDVALKVLPAAFAHDSGRMIRFQREAEVLASLNHPNIAHLYGIEEQALVMELVEGETLPCPLPVETALKYAKQIAEALEYAHEKGVVHRDLKPANIKITPEGVVKVLDFGLAKAIDDPVPSADPSNSPTLTLGATSAGVILGTAAYMSPEQAVGKPADRRSDIFSFGVVLFEMLSGKPAFVGESVGDTLAAVVKDDPDWSKLPAAAPAPLRTLLGRCLTKDRKQRLQAIGEARIAIEESLSGAPPKIAESVQAKRSTLPWVVAGVLAAALAVVGSGWWRASRPIEQPLVRLNVDLGPEISLASPRRVSDGSVIISPDGTRLVYLASVAGSQPKLLIRKLDQPKATELPGTEGARSPFFSPDGQWVGFVGGTKLNKISVEGGSVVPLADIVNSAFFAGANWGEDGDIVMGQFTKGLVRSPSVGGGASMPVTELASGEVGHALPQILPGGKAVLFVAYTSPDSDNASIQVVSLADGRRKTLVHGGTSPHYLATSNGAGHLVYSNKGTLFAIPFDLNHLETRGAPIPVLDGIGYGTQFGAAQFDVSRSGTLVNGTGSAGTGMMTVQWLDRATGKLDGASAKKQPLWAKPGIYAMPRLSPDGQRLALSVSQGGREDVWLYDLRRDAMGRLTMHGERNPTWSRPDGRYIVFSALSGGMSWTRADGSGEPQPLTNSKNVQIPTSFSPDGKRLAYSELDTASRSVQIWTLPVEDNGGQLRAGKPELFRSTQFNDALAAFSPDGRWLAYQSSDSGVIEVVVRAFPASAAGQDRIWRISNNGGQDPVWSPTGQELLYQSGDQIMAVKYTVKGDSFDAERPTVWAPKLGGVGGVRSAWDLAPDGKRVVVLTPVESAEAPKQEHEIVMLLNFFDELRRKVPVGK
jgi:serine/threonine-protein kinase